MSVLTYTPSGWQSWSSEKRGAAIQAAIREFQAAVHAQRDGLAVFCERAADEHALLFMNDRLYAACEYAVCDL